MIEGATIKKAEVVWENDQWNLKVDFHEPDMDEVVQSLGTITKEEAQAYARRWCQPHDDQVPGFELIFKNKNGQIGKGSSSKQTYGRDPKGEG